MNNISRLERIKELTQDILQKYLSDISVCKHFFGSSKIWNNERLSEFKNLKENERSKGIEYRYLSRLQCLFEYVFKSLDELYTYEKDLLQEQSQERALTAHLVNYLKSYFTSYNVDCDYKNHLGNTKLITPKALASERPDIIIHERGSDNENLFAFEIKHKTSFRERDYEKLKFLTLQNGNYKYKIGFALKLNEIDNQIEIFINGCRITDSPI